MNGQTDRQKVDGQTDEQTDRRMGKQVNRQTDGRTNRRRGRQTDKQYQNLNTANYPDSNDAKKTGLACDLYI